MSTINSEVDWNAARIEYVTGTDGPYTLAKKYGVTGGRVSQVLDEEGWKALRAGYRDKVFRMRCDAAAREAAAAFERDAVVRLRQVADALTLAVQRAAQAAAAFEEPDGQSANAHANRLRNLAAAAKSVLDITRDAYGSPNLVDALRMQADVDRLALAKQAAEAQAGVAGALIQLTEGAKELSE